MHIVSVYKDSKKHNSSKLITLTTSIHILTKVYTSVQGMQQATTSLQAYNISTASMHKLYIQEAYNIPTSL